MGSLVWADFNRSYKRPGTWPTRPPAPIDPEPMEIDASQPDRAGVNAEEGALTDA